MSLFYLAAMICKVWHCTWTGFALEIIRGSTGCTHINGESYEDLNIRDDTEYGISLD